MTLRTVVSRVPWAPVLLSSLMWAPVLGLVAAGSASALPMSEDHQVVPVGEFAGYGTGKLAYFWLSELLAGAFLPAQGFGEFCRWSSSCSCQVCYGTAEIGGSHFRAPGIGFIGFVFSHGGGGAQYGWARIKTSGPPNYRFHLLDYAWGDPGDRFFTGQTRLTPCASTPCPDEQAEAPPPKEGSLGWLALGAAGLLAWRKRRSRAAH